MVYQWRRGGIDIPGANGAVYSVAAAGMSAEGVYDVVVSSWASVVVSEPARLEVFGAMSVKVMPSGGYAAVVPEVGQQTKMVRLEAVGGLGEKGTYRWYKNGQWLSDGASFEVAAVDELGVYRVEVVLMQGTQVLGSARSEEVPVQLMRAVSVSRGAADVTVEAGGVAVFTAEGVGGGTIGYQWERLRSGRWEKVTGASGRELRFGSVRTSDAGQYRVVVSNARNGVVSEGTLKSTSADGPLGLRAQRHTPQTTRPANTLKIYPYKSSIKTAGRKTG
jgi:hypothetical protein